MHARYKRREGLEKNDIPERMGNKEDNIEIYCSFDGRVHYWTMQLADFVPRV